MHLRSAAVVTLTWNPALPLCHNYRNIYLFRRWFVSLSSGVQRNNDGRAAPAQRPRAQPPPGRELPDLLPVPAGDAAVQTTEPRQGTANQEANLWDCKKSATYLTQPDWKVRHEEQVLQCFQLKYLIRHNPQGDYIRHSVHLQAFWCLYLWPAFGIVLEAIRAKCRQ